MVSLGRHAQVKYITGTRLGANHCWEGVRAERWRHTEGDLGEVQVRDTELVVLLQGRLHVRRRGDGQLQQCNAVPGTIWLCPNGVREDMIRLYGDVPESLHLFLPALPLARTVVREIDLDPDTVHLRYHGGFRDPLIEQMAWAIRAEMTDPAPAGSILIETLGTALGVHLVRHYSNLKHASISLPRTRGALDPRRLRRVTDFIEAHLSEDLTIAALAKEACLSPFHFARTFKAATGTAPHRYITDRRIGRAKTLIAEGELPLNAVAHESGFSSQAHLTQWFKRFVGNTPGEYRSMARRTPGRPGSPRDDRGDKIMALATERRSGVVCIDVSGRIDGTTSDAFRKEVRNASKEADRAMIFDLGGITVISYEGLQTLLVITRNLQGQGTRVVLCTISARVREKLRVTGFERLLPIHKSKAEAVASLDVGSRGYEHRDDVPRRYHDGSSSAPPAAGSTSMELRTQASRI